MHEYYLALECPLFPIEPLHEMGLQKFDVILRIHFHPFFNEKRTDKPTVIYPSPKHYSPTPLLAFKASGAYTAVNQPPSSEGVRLILRGSGFIRE